MAVDVSFCSWVNYGYVSPHFFSPDNLGDVSVNYGYVSWVLFRGLSSVWLQLYPLSGQPETSPLEDPKEVFYFCMITKVFRQQLKNLVISVLKKVVY